MVVAARSFLEGENLEQEEVERALDEVGRFAHISVTELSIRANGIGKQGETGSLPRRSPTDSAHSPKSLQRWSGSAVDGFR